MLLFCHPISSFYNFFFLYNILATDCIFLQQPKTSQDVLEIGWEDFLHGCYIHRLFTIPGSVCALPGHPVSWDASGCPGSAGSHGPHFTLRNLLHAMTTTGSSCVFPVHPVLASAPRCLAQAQGLSRAFLTWVMCWVRDARLCAWDQAAHPWPHQTGAQMYQIWHCGSSL